MPIAEPETPSPVADVPNSDRRRTFFAAWIPWIKRLVFVVVAVALAAAANQAVGRWQTETAALQSDIDSLRDAASQQSDPATRQAMLGEVESRSRQVPSLANLNGPGLALAATLYGLGLLPPGWILFRTLSAMRIPVSFARSTSAQLLGHAGKYIPGKAMVVVLRVGAILPNATDPATSTSSSVQDRQPGMMKPEPTALVLDSNTELTALAAGSDGFTTHNATPEASAYGSQETPFSTPQAQPSQAESEQDERTEPPVTDPTVNERPVAKATASVFYETLLMMGVGGILSGILLLNFPLPNWIRAMAFMMAIGSAIPVFPPVMRWLLSRLQKNKSNKPQYESISWRLLLESTLVSSLSWLLIGGSFAVLIVSIPSFEPVSFDARLFTIATASISLGMVLGFASLLPGGAGVREYATLLVLTPSIGPTHALLAVIAARLMFILVEAMMAGLAWWSLRTDSTGHVS